MAKTIMIADDVYKDLKRTKTLENKSFSEVIRDMKEKNKIKTGKDLWRIFGTMNDDGWDEHLEELKEGWRKWSERYA